HWCNELIRPATDRALIARRMKALLAREPLLESEENQALLKSLEAALVPRRAKFGSIEAAIDDLVELSLEPREYRHRFLDPRYGRLAEMGFDAVPALIEHLDDDRLSRTVELGVFRRSTCHLRVKDLVRELLGGLAGAELAPSSGLQKEEAQRWWHQARKL